MGKVEKIVVLSVLFLITVIVVLSLSTGRPDEAIQAAGPLDSSTSTPFELRVAEGPRDRSPETSEPMDPVAAGLDPIDLMGDDDLSVGSESIGAYGEPRHADAGDVPSTSASGADLGLLSSSVASAARAPEERRVPRLSVQPDWDLKTVEGLDKTNHPGFLTYRCTRGDTFERLALELYGDAAKAELLRRNNEGLQVLESGLEILVPVRDDRGPDAGEYVVQEGESLWLIAKRFYGAGSRWGEIFEANRDLLSSPEAVRQGMTLRIP